MVADFVSKPPAGVQETIAWLLRLGRPPLPESPIEAAKQGKEPKQPCYFDGKRVIPISWKQWQNEQPIADIYKAWFTNAKTGIGTLGGWNGKHWLGWVDFDQKDFASPQECDRVINNWVEQYPVMATAPMFRTPSGGYRFLVAFSREPENFKANSGFSLSPDGSHHVGELLSKNGGHTLLPPTVGVSGKPYRWERFCEYPPIVERPKDVGIYPVQKRTQTKPAVAPERENKSEDTSLTELLEREIYPRLTADVAFGWPGHDFKSSGNKLKGNCPWHESQSGTAFYVDFKDGAWLWRCPACEIGGGVIQYRHRLAGGNGSPQGKDFVDVVRELADDVGVPMPECKQRSSKSSSSRNSNVVSLRLPAQEKKLTCFDLVAEVEQAMNIENPAEQFFELKQIQSQLKGWNIKDLMELHNRHETGKRGFNVTGGSEFLSKATEKFNWLVDTLIVQGVNMLCYADSGVGKSLLFYDLCLSIINGTPWNGFSVKQGKVLIIQTDEPSIVTARRLKKMGFDQTPPDSWYIEQNWQFSQVRQLERWIKENRPAFVMIDCLTTSNRSSASEEKDVAYTLVQNDLMKLADQYQCTIVTLHHENKMGGIRGSSGLPAHVSEVWHLSKKNNNEQLSDLHRVLEVVKSRTDCNGSYILELDPTTYKWNYQGDLEEPQATGGGTVKALALAWLKSKTDDHWYESELVAGGIGKPVDSTRRTLRQLADQGIIDSTELPLKTSKGERMVVKYRYSRTNTSQCSSDRERVKPSQGADANPITHSRSHSRSHPSDRENVTADQSGTFSRSDQSDQECDRETRSGKNPYAEPVSVPDRSSEGGEQFFESTPESSTTTTALPPATTAPHHSQQPASAANGATEVESYNEPAPHEREPYTQLLSDSTKLRSAEALARESEVFPSSLEQAMAEAPTPSPENMASAEARAPSPDDKWLTPENLQAMADMLCVCDSSELLADLRKTWPTYALIAASKLLDADTRQQIKAWVLEQNQSTQTDAAPTPAPQSISESPGHPPESNKQGLSSPAFQKRPLSPDAPAIDLKSGMWVCCLGDFYGHLGAQIPDGRWYVLRPKTRLVDAESRLVAPADIIPMPPR